MRTSLSAILRGTARRSILSGVALVAAVVGPASRPCALAAEPAAPLAIEPMTTVTPPGPAGYFEDPYPVRLAPAAGDAGAVFSGTTQAIMRGAFPLSPGGFSWTPVAIDRAPLQPAIDAAGATFTNYQNLDAFQDDRGDWHAVLAIGVRNAEHPDYWTVLVHARPATAPAPGQVPLAWTADTVLSGSFARRVDGNYDGKYLEDGGRLYLLYVRNFVEKPGLRNGIVLQPMLSPTRKAPGGPVTLLLPGGRFGPLGSEDYDHTPAKLVEAPTIVRIGGKYALTYSTGAFQQIDYKAGIAWSDTLIPPPGGGYRKVYATDTLGVWGPPGRPQVRYLLQSERPHWPDFTAGQVISPGVASAIQGPGGAWFLCFAGYSPADRPLIHPGVANAHHRRPYFVRLRVAVPPDASVVRATDAALATWLQPEMR